MPIEFPASPSNGDIFTYGDTSWVYNASKNAWILVPGEAEGGGGGGPATWGEITGTLSAQTDLQSALNAKAATSHTHSFASLTSKPTTLAGYGITDGANIPPLELPGLPYSATGEPATQASSRIQFQPGYVAFDSVQITLQGTGWFFTSSPSNPHDFPPGYLAEMAADMNSSQDVVLVTADSNSLLFTAIGSGVSGNSITLEYYATNYGSGSWPIITIGDEVQEPTDSWLPWNLGGGMDEDYGTTATILGQLAFGYAGVFPYAAVMGFNDNSIEPISVFMDPDGDPELYFTDGDITSVSYDFDLGRWVAELDEQLYVSETALFNVHPTTLTFDHYLDGEPATVYPVVSAYPKEVYVCTRVWPAEWRLLTETLPPAPPPILELDSPPVNGGAGASAVIVLDFTSASRVGLGGGDATFQFVGNTTAPFVVAVSAELTSDAAGVGIANVVYAESLTALAGYFEVDQAGAVLTFTSVDSIYDPGLTVNMSGLMVFPTFTRTNVGENQGTVAVAVGQMAIAGEVGFQCTAIAPKYIWRRTSGVVESTIFPTSGATLTATPWADQFLLAVVDEELEELTLELPETFNAYGSQVVALQCNQPVITFSVLPGMGTNLLSDPPVALDAGITYAFMYTAATRNWIMI